MASVTTRSVTEIVAVVDSNVTMFCEAPTSEYYPTRVRWYFTSNDNKTAKVKDSVITRQCDELNFRVHMCIRSLHIDHVQHQDAGRYVCVVSGHFSHSRHINLYNATYLLHVYGQTQQYRYVGLGFYKKITVKISKKSTKSRLTPAEL